MSPLRLVPLVWLLALAACASPSLPDGYTGPTATIESSMTPGGNSADFFDLTGIDGKMVYPPDRPGHYPPTWGTGNSVFQYDKIYTVPARPARFTIEAQRQWIMPFLAMIDTTQPISGTTAFTPEAGHTYRVFGSLTKTHGFVAIRDEQTRRVLARFGDGAP